ncbi:MAG: InlB B-repeat-containing protein, partial [Lachnospiraceae bacterium]|nr:InlB B-repeat-containing protein [Lachnospiraceae bacterium]
MSRIISRHVKRKIAAALLATMLIDQFPVSVYAGPLEWETISAEDATVMEEEQIIPAEEQTGEEATPAGQEQTGMEETAPAGEDQTTPEEETGAAEEEEEAVSENTEPEAVPEGSSNETVEEAAGDSETVNYIDENGDTQTCDNATVLKGNESDLGAGWYVVNRDISYTSTLNCNGDCHIILADTWKMNIGSSDGPGLVGGGYSLTIYGQSGGSGELNILTTNINSHGILVNNLTVNGGKINAVTQGRDSTGIQTYNDLTINGGEVYAESKGNDTQNYGLMVTEKITINGGQVTAKGGHAGIYSTYRGAHFLSWKNETDYVSTNSFDLNSTNDKGTFEIASGKTFTDGEKYYINANANEIKSLTNVTLRPTTDTFYTVNFDCGSYNGDDVPPVQLLKSESKVTRPADPAGKVGDASFAGWYRDYECTVPYNFDLPVTSDLTIYAKWAKRSYNIADANIKMIYRHTGISIDPVVWDNIGTKLTKNTNYTIESCKKHGTNTSADMKEPGFYDLVINGKYPYTGSKTVEKVCVLTFGEYNPDTNELNNNATLPEGEEAAVVTASTVTMNSGWYVVTEDVAVQSRMKVNGDVHLVLCDGATLEAGENKGISVREGNSLTIYSQEGNTGKLIASSNEVIFYAGIGGDCADGTGNGNAGTITIHGGVIEARGSKYSAAIGKAGNTNANGNGGRIIIYGGQITALRYTQIVNTDNDGEKETGIGGPGADIRLSWCRESGAGSDFIVSDGYDGNVAFTKPFIIAGTSTLAKADNIKGEKTRIEPTESGETYTVTFDSQGGTAIKPQNVILGKTAEKPVTPIKQGYRFEGWYNNGILYGFSTPVNDNLTLTAKWQDLAKVSYLNENGASTQTVYSPMEADYTVLPSGYYYVSQNMELLNRISISGNVSLILGDNQTLTAPKGISVMDSKNTLNIFGQSGGTGLLKANATSGNAAIGGNKENAVTERPSGNINIYGGMIRALGGENGASIGGGLNSKNYGNIRIYGGTVSALSTQYGAAIGGGKIDSESVSGGSGSVEIRGGVVTVSADFLGTGIGGGNHAYGGVISILGGKVTVTVLDKDCCSGIGDGYYGGTSKPWENMASITLGCSRDDDFIYSAGYSGSVKIAPNQTLLIDDDHSIKLAGNITDLKKITGKKLILGHSHSFIYTANGSTITAKCQNSNCNLTNNTATLTLNAPDASTLVYDGTPKPAVVTDQFNISGDAVVKYRKKKSDSSWGEAVAVAPKDAGDYRASITLADTGHGTATASVEYTIRKRDVTITGLIANDKIYDGTTTASVNDTGMKIEGMVSGDAVSVNSGIANFNSPDAGDNKTVTFTNYSLTGEAAGNYNLAQPAQATANISKRPVTIRALDQTVQLGDSIEYAIDYKDLADGQELKHVDLTPDPDPANCNTPTDNGTITPANAVIKIRNTGTDVTKNYDITYVSGNLKISLVMAKVTKNPTPRLNLKYEGYLNWQDLVNPGEAETKMEYNVLQIRRGDGELLKKDGRYVYEITPTDGYVEKCSVWESGSYHVWYRAASDNKHAPSVPQCISVDVARVPLTVRVRDAAISYGEKFPDQLVLDSEGYVNSEDSGYMGNRKYDYKIGGSWKAWDDVKNMYPDLGSYPARITYYRESTDTGPTVLYCYDISYIPGIMTVEPRTVGLKWGTANLTFNGTPQAPTVTLRNLSPNEAPDAVGVTVTGARVNATPYGQTYTATAVGLSGDKAGKYALPADNTKDFTIAKADYAGTITNVEVTVPVSADSFTASVAGKMSADAGTITYDNNVGLSSDGFEIADGVFDAQVDKNGLVTVTRKKEVTINGGNKLTASVKVHSTNYNDIAINAVATFVNKTDAG